MTGSTLVTSLPSTVSVPDVGSIIRLIIRIEVVLPQPDGPTNTVSVPSGTSQRQVVDGDGAVRVLLGDVREGDHGCLFLYGLVEAVVG